jgi:hypothetical protein
VSGASGAQHQKPESKPPQGNPVGVALCRRLEQRLDQHVASCAGQVHRAHMMSDADWREKDAQAAAYVRTLRKELRVRDGKLVAIAFAARADAQAVVGEQTFATTDG